MPTSAVPLDNVAVVDKVPEADVGDELLPAREDGCSTETPPTVEAKLREASNDGYFAHEEGVSEDLLTIAYFNRNPTYKYGRRP